VVAQHLMKDPLLRPALHVRTQAPVLASATD
jgi:hypothetical protein